MGEARAAVWLTEVTQAMEAYNHRAITSNELLSYMKRISRKFAHVTQRCLDWKSDCHLLDALELLTSNQAPDEVLAEARTNLARDLSQVETQSKQAEALKRLHDG